MADSILRLKVESQEYDNKLKQAAQGLTRYADECRKVGGTLEVVEKDTLDYVRALGQMDTTSRTATGKLAEMKKTFTELSVVYKNMTDEEKNSPFGKALATSLDQLKGRIQDSKSQLDDINKSVNGGGGLTGALDNLAGKFGMSVQSLASWGTALAAAKGALDVAKDAFFASEANVDEWGRTMQSAEALYSGFVTALNSSDFSSFLTQIDGIVQAARKAYDELDKLGTMRTIQAPGFAKQEAENQRLRLMIMTGKFIEADDGRKSPLGLKNGDILSPEQIRTLERQLQNGMNKIVSLTKNELGQTGKAIDAYYNSLAKQNGMTMQEFREGTSSWASFSEKMAGYEAYKKWDREARTEFARQGGRGYVDFDKNNPYVEFRKWGTFRVDKMGQNSYNDLVGLIKQQQQQQQQMYSTLGQTYRTINRAEGFTVRKILNGATTTTSHKATPQETAANKVKEAERTYAETLLKNSIRLEEGMDTTLEYKKRELSAQERLFDAYNDAYATYQDPAYKKASTEAAEKIKTLAGEVKAASDAQEAAMKSARELDAAQRKLADAQQKLAEARATGSATAVYKAQQEVDKRQKVVEHVQYVADVKAGKMPTLPENMKAEMVVTANTDEAVRALQAIQGIKIDSKSFTVSTDDADAMARLHEIDGVTIDDKTMTVTATTDEALRALQAIQGIKIDSKSFTVSTDDADAMARLREIDGVTIDDKTLTVTATTDEAVRALQAIQGIKIDSKSFTVSTDDAEALAKVSEIDGVKIGQKTFTVTADDEDVLAKLREILDKLSEIQGVTIDTKTFTISTDNKEALAKVREIQDLKIDPKTVKIVQDVSETGKKSSFDNLVETVQAEIKFDQMKVDETALHTLLKNAIQSGIDNGLMNMNFASISDQIAQGIDVPDEKWQKILDQYNKLREAIGETPIEIDFKTGNIKGGNKSDVENVKNFNDKLSQLNGGVGSIVSGIQQMGVEIPKELQSTLSVLQGISTIMTGVLAIITLMNAKQTVQTGMSFIPFFAHGGLVHAATGYMVPGNDHADRTLIAASSGELILNRAQQGVIASQLENGNGGGMRVVGEIQGEKIVLVANRFLNRSGQGELVTWK